MQTYLRRFYFDEAKLRERTLIEFAHALHTGRMVAVIGSMVTREAGYVGWNDFIEKYVGEAKGLLEIAERVMDKTCGGHGRIPALNTARSAIEAMNSSTSDEKFDGRVRASVVREALRHVDEQWREAGNKPLANPDGHPATLEQCLVASVAGHFRKRRFGKIEAVTELIESLDIRRFATLNYDLELEFALMAPRDVRETAAVEPGPDDPKEFNTFEALETMLRCGDILHGADLSENWWSRKSSGRRVESDILKRQRLDRLLEFSIGSKRIDRHILHLHGRADDPDSMLVGLRDYDRLYRKTDQSTVPFHAGQRLLFSGNPILFVGIGMTEAEVNAQLQQLVSNHPYRHVTPTFLLWNSSGFICGQDQRDHWKRAKRLDWLHRLGVMVIYDEDLIKAGNCPELGARAGHVIQLAGEAAKIEADARSTGSLPVKDLEEWKGEVEESTRRLLAPTLRELGEEAVRISRRSLDEIDDWRAMRSRIAKTDNGSLRCILWSRKEAYAGKNEQAVPERQDLAHATEILGNAFGNAGDEACPDGGTAAPVPVGECLYVLTGPRGSGRGRLARTIYDMPLDTGELDKEFGKLKHRFLVNAGFSFDTDSMLDALVRFINGILFDSFELPAESREAFLCARVEEATAKKLDALVIVNGMERFFDLDGKPLSVELDQVCRALANLNFDTLHLRCVFIGTERIVRYFQTIAPRARFGKVTRLTPASIGPVMPDRIEDRPLESPYLEGVRQKFDAKMKNHPRSVAAKATIPPAPAGDRSSLPKSFFRYYLDSDILKLAGVRKPGLCFDILRALAFIGTPVELAVLRHAPVVRNRLNRLKRKAASGEDERQVLEAAIQDLQALDLVVPVQSFEDYGNGTTPGDDDALWRRYGLHKSLLDELRGRSGISLAPSKRSTAFNLSLYVAQPIEGDKPNATIHDELGSLVDHLIGAYKDDPLPAVAGERDLTTPGVEQSMLETAVKAARKRLPPGALRKPKKGEDEDFEKFLQLIHPETTASLRAALAVIRGYYSTSSLLAVDHLQRRNAEERDGALLEHAERLDRLLRGFRKVAVLRQELRKILPPGEHGELRAAPFYADELVWLYNEIGVVHLAMGDLYKSQMAFDAAERVNQGVEHGERSHNWRRITLNRIMLDIERGRLNEAERRIALVEDSVNRRRSYSKAAPTGQSRVEQIVALFGSKEEPERSCFHDEIMHDEILTAGLALGFRAMCANLRGRFEEAWRNYDRAANIMRRVGQPRAYAMFLQNATSLAHAMDNRKMYTRLLADTLAVSQSGGQNDIACHAKLIAAADRFRRGTASGDQSAGLRELEEARNYSIQTDIYRLRVDAGTKLARVMLATGDAATALEHATDALIYATAFGMTLRKIVLRIHIGEIYKALGDFEAGNGAIAAASEEAERIGFRPSATFAKSNRWPHAASAPS